jgi:hypothetical protein
LAVSSTALLIALAQFATLTLLVNDTFSQIVS